MCVAETAYIICKEVYPQPDFLGRLVFIETNPLDRNEPLAFFRCRSPKTMTRQNLWDKGFDRYNMGICQSRDVERLNELVKRLELGDV